jgi:hypothetical protein
MASNRYNTADKTPDGFLPRNVARQRIDRILLRHHRDATSGYGNVTTLVSRVLPSLV